MDTTLIPNKLGIDKISFNVQLLKHKSTKLSLITDIKSVPLHANIYKKQYYKTMIQKILIDQLDEVMKETIIKTKNKNLRFLFLS